MRRALALGALTLLVLVPVAAGCGDSEPTPTVASIAFTSKASIEIADTGPLTVEVDGGGGEIESGSVLLVTNTGESQHRLVGTIDTTEVFDTGTLEAGDRTTLKVVSEGELKIADLSTDREVTITVKPSD